MAILLRPALLRRAAAAIAAGALGALLSTACAGSARAADDPPFGARAAVLDAVALDRVRGGYASGGMILSFGIERSVLVNGALVTQTTLRFAAGRDATAASSAGSGGALASSSVALGTIVQNSLDGQTIQSRTVIEVTANSLGLLRQANFQASLRGVVIDSLRR